MQPGDIRYGYIHAQEPYLSLLTKSGIATIFIYRDPRDMIVSHVYYAAEMYPGHGMHSYYTKNLSTMEERINAAILGVEEPGYELSSVKQRYDNYKGWLSQPEVLSIKFEDLILNREFALGQLLDFIELRGAQWNLRRWDAIKVLEDSIIPHKSGTFRKGVPGNWREVFTEKNTVTFNHIAGDLLHEFGYDDPRSI